MSRRGELLEGDDRGFPRVSGDEPAMMLRPLDSRMFSPRERG